LYKSVDGGSSWKHLTEGLPPEGEVGRIGMAVAPSDPQRLYAVVDVLQQGGRGRLSGPPERGDARQRGGIYRSDDAGASWRRVNGQPRLWGRGFDFAEVKVDSKNKDILYVANTSTYRSTDAGQTFTAWKGAPGGDDYHTLWINP